MKKRKTISVAMAVYNGEKYLEEQLISILGQLGEGDEVIISLDPSIDKTETIVRDYCKRDKRIHVCRGQGQGVIKNFENAVCHCRNEIIFLADQDDVWMQNKVSLVLEQFEDSEVVLVMHDSKVVDEHLEIMEASFFSIKNSRPGILINIMKNSYIGCCMAFRRKCLRTILPFPKDIPMHDQWIGICCEHMGRVVFLPKKLLLYRRHGENVSHMQHASFVQMFVWRWNLLKAIVARILLKVS